MCWLTPWSTYSDCSPDCELADRRAEGIPVPNINFPWTMFQLFLMLFPFYRGKLLPSTLGQRCQITNKIQISGGKKTLSYVWLTLKINFIILRIRDGTTQMNASKWELIKIPKDITGAITVVRKLSCPVFINLCVSDISVKNVFQVYAAWLAEIIMIRKLNSILHITVEHDEIFQKVSTQQKKNQRVRFLPREGFWS